MTASGVTPIPSALPGLTRGEPLREQILLPMSGYVPEMTSSKRRPQLPLFVLSELLGALVWSVA